MFFISIGALMNFFFKTNPAFLFPGLILPGENKTSTKIFEPNLNQALLNPGRGDGH